MNATATKPPRKTTKRESGNGHHAGHATPEESRHFLDRLEEAADDAILPVCWEEVKPRLRSVLHLPKGRVSPEDHLRAVQLESQIVVLGEELDEATAIVRKYFPGEFAGRPGVSALSSAGSAPPRENPPAEKRAPRRGAEKNKNAETVHENGQAKKTAEAKEIVAKVSERNFGGQTLSRVTWADCVPHPDNDPARAGEIDSLAESLQAEGMLEPPVVRPLPAGHPHKPQKGAPGNRGQRCWQILSGHRRIAAARKLGWQEGDAHVVHCDDARALELVAIYNAQRRDLSPIEKAKMIRRLCQSVPEGGSGYTREQAAKVYDLESGSAASNLVRLLELPQVWQDRVASGELPWTWARELCVPAVLQLPPVQKALEDEWKMSRDPTRNSWDETAFDSRQKLIEAIPELVRCECRRLDAPRWDGSRHSVPTIDAADPEIRKRLGIVDVELPPNESRKGKLKPVAVATNVEAFEKWLESSRGKASRDSAEKAGRDEPAPKRELTPAEKKQRAADRARQLKDRIADWRHKLLRRLLVRKLADREDSGFRLVLAYAAAPAWRGPSIDFVLEKAAGKRVGGGGFRDGRYWPAVTLLEHEATDWRQPTLPHALVERYAEDLGVDVAGGWAGLQGPAGGKPDPLLEEFFLLHRTEELRELAKELGVHAPRTAGRAGIVKLLLAVMPLRRLKLPQSIKPVAGAKSRVPSARSKVAKGGK